MTSGREVKRDTREGCSNQERKMTEAQPRLFAVGLERGSVSEYAALEAELRGFPDSLDLGWAYGRGVNEDSMVWGYIPRLQVHELGEMKEGRKRKGREKKRKETRWELF